MRTTLRTALATAVAVSLTGGLLGLTTGAATAAAPAKAAKPAKYATDFNGDGHPDYVRENTIKQVTVTYGTAKGPGTKTFTFDQDSPGIPGVRHHDTEGFGATLASADLNGDGYADLVVSDPWERIGTTDTEQGMVIIVWGSETGLGSKATVVDAPPPTRNQNFGIGLATGDFSGDGKPDLAITDNRSVYIHRGGFTPSGSTGEVSTFTPPADSHFEPGGLAAGRVTKDKSTDLYAIGVVDLGSSGIQRNWFFKGGSTIKPDKLRTAAKPTKDFETGGGVIADFDKDGYGDLVVGDPDKKYAGGIRVQRGGKNGPTTSYRLNQDTPGVATTAEPHEGFGHSFSAGDTNRDGYPDLAVGTNERIDNRQVGGAHVLRGGKKGLTGTGSQWFTRDTPGIPGKTLMYENFGTWLKLHDFDRDGDADLLLNGARKSGQASTLLNGGSQGITTKGIREVPTPWDFL
ncbi:FG-GAP repeat domain-containing protein [Streptomyces jumonjinensis]|uniref:VCBS repeat-containing protein n=1 Tax=Streptomyces jumonjinensis TaxID=1945 RepID=A0A646KH22_STRJU|nr:VCBS repeat-containing protein [Streptomyces jumonjinensis]MQT01297.1 VCBS repeat-containing protein [Streptomyces jumonjinensis]